MFKTDSPQINSNQRIELTKSPQKLSAKLQPPTNEIDDEQDKVIQPKLISEPEKMMAPPEDNSNINLLQTRIPSDSIQMAPNPGANSEISDAIEEATDEEEIQMQAYPNQEMIMTAADVHLSGEKTSSTSFIQAKLKIGQPGDKYEKEADRNADVVIQRLSQPGSTHTELSGNHFENNDQPQSIQLKCSKCEALEEIQFKENSNASGDYTGIESKLNRTKGTGSPLPADSRVQMEGAFGRDFSNVRIHTGSQAVEMNRGLNAKAFTHGSDIYFNSNTYDAKSTQGKGLLAHELTHTVQQSASGTTKPNVQRVSAGDIWDATGGRVVNTVRSGANEIGELASDAWESGTEFLVQQIESRAPELMSFLRGNIIETIYDRILSSIDTALGGIISRIQAEGLANVLRSFIEAFLEFGNAAVTSGCRAVFSAAEKLTAFFRRLTGPAVAAVRRFMQSISTTLSSIWNDMALPAVRAIRQYAGDVWDFIVEKATWLWEKTEPVRNWMQRAWDWIKRQFNIAWNGANSVLDWLTEKATAAWNRVKELIQPIIRPLMIIGGILLMLSPVGPIIAIVAAAPHIWHMIQWLASNFNEYVLVRARTFLHEQVFPVLQDGLQQLQSLIQTGMQWLQDQLSSLANTITDWLEQIGVFALLSTVRDALRTVATGLRTAFLWVIEQLTPIVNGIIGVLRSIWEFIRPLVVLVAKLYFLAVNPWLWPTVITAWFWRIMPDCFKPPIINWVISIMIRVLRVMPDISYFLDAWPQVRDALVTKMVEVQSASDDEKIRISNKIAEMISELQLEPFANLVRAAMEMPGQFEGQFEEEIIGMDLTKPLPIERTSPVSSMSNDVSSAVASGDLERLMSQDSFTDDDITVDNVSQLEIEPDILAQMGDRDVVEFGNSTDSSRTVQSILQDISGQSATGQGGDLSSIPAEGTVSGEDNSVEAQLDRLIASSREEMSSQPCGGESQSQSTPSSAGNDIPEAMKIGPLTRSQRARFMMSQMGAGLSHWWGCNRSWLIPSVIGAVVVLIILEVVTEGTVTALLPPILEALAAIMIGVAAVRSVLYLTNYLMHGMLGNVEEAARSLARGIAVVAAEVVFLLTFEVIGKAIKAGLAGMQRAGRALLRGVKAIPGVTRAGRSVAQFGRNMIRRGRLVMEGIREGRYGRGIRRINDLAEGLYRRVRFRRFRLRRVGRRLLLEGYINPWVVLANGDIEYVDGPSSNIRGRSVTTPSGRTGYAIGGPRNVARTGAPSDMVQFFRANPERAAQYFNLLDNLNTPALRSRAIRAIGNFHYGGGRYTDILTVLDDLAQRGTPGLNTLIGDLARGGPRQIGAEWVISFLRAHPNHRRLLTNLEEFVRIGQSRRFYDAVIGGVKFEFKSWSSFSAGSRRRLLQQMMNDLRGNRPFHWLWQRRGTVTGTRSLRENFTRLLADENLLRGYGYSTQDIRYLQSSIERIMQSTSVL